VTTTSKRCFGVTPVIIMSDDSCLNELKTWQRSMRTKCATKAWFKRASGLMIKTFGFINDSAIFHLVRYFGAPNTRTIRKLGAKKTFEVNKKAVLCQPLFDDIQSNH
jgi:hypothetical protein